ncbi:major facilitator superfamily transporter multidrug resistance [Grosmannia clavigera kw1407]|uniref:Major facilitator superfamily transporter multidrug resistance n=1 Tax=Grosmannia clavigera (strain kw1407 / UAMH 11150) TaxID=655863 RepID=F0XGT3_GROCL|nr:major facilitator superfamily transporter multidrug resistance [Grosmannia clavigera kw1407]EFX03213.1 major facilitator superfamily transporter multidrug resistance [Grosmannia clavigera kw1407]
MVTAPEFGSAEARNVRETDALLPAVGRSSLANGDHGNNDNCDDSGDCDTISDNATVTHIGPSRAAAIAVNMGVLLFLQASNTSGMTMAQSAIADDLDAYEHAMWFSSAYLISVASFAPLVGRLATIFPAGHLLLGAGICFAAGALITAYANSLSVFLLGRVIIGIGGAGVMTLSLILVLQLADRRRRGLFVGMVNAAFTVGLSAGAIVYGALLPIMSWRTLFLVQAPMALIAGVLVFFSLPHLSQHQPDGKGRSVWYRLARIDYAGAFFLTLTIVLLLYSLSGTWRPLAMLASVTSLVCFVAIEYWLVPNVSGGDPIIPLELLRSRGVLFSCLAQLGVMASRWSVLYYAPIFVLTVQGQSAAVAGAALIPTNVGFGTGGLLVGWLHIRRAGDFWLPSVVSIFLFCCSLAAVGLLSRASDSFSAGWYMLSLFTNGFCTGAFLNYTLAHLLHLTRPSTHFVATSLLATFRGFSGSFGTSIGGGFFMQQLGVQLATGFTELDGGNLTDAHTAMISRLIGSPALVHGSDGNGRPVLTNAERQVAIAGYAASLGTLYHAAAIVGLLMLVVQACTGWAEPKSRASTEGGGLQQGAKDDEEEDEEEILEAIAEHNGAMEA